MLFNKRLSFSDWLSRSFYRNYRRRFKFGPYFLSENFCVIDILVNRNILLIENTVSGLVVFVYKDTQTISNCLIAHYPSYICRPSK